MNRAHCSAVSAAVNVTPRGVVCVLGVCLLGACGSSSTAGETGSVTDGGLSDGTVIGEGGQRTTGADGGGSSDGAGGTSGVDGAINDTADGILTNLIGARTGDSGTFSAPDFAHGFATRTVAATGVSTLSLVFTDYPGGCTYAAAGGYLSGGETFTIAIKVPAGSSFASLTEYGTLTNEVFVQDSPTTWTAGVDCVGPDSDAGVPSPAIASAGIPGGVILYSVSDTRVTGHFTFSSSGAFGMIDGVFDLPVCSFPVVDAGAAASSAVCVPTMGGLAIDTPTSPCVGVTSPTASGGTLTDVVGSWSGDAGTFPTAAFNTGFANVEPIQIFGLVPATNVYLEFADYPNSCGDGLAGVRATGGHTFEIAVALSGDGGAPPAVTPGTYTSVIATMAPQEWTAAGNATCAEAETFQGSNAHGTVILSAADSSHVAGTFQLPSVGDAGPLSGTFDLPICNPPAYDGGAPQLCCF
jgi:hypothetical protein